MALEKLAQIPSLVRKAGQAASKAQPFYSPVDQAIANITQGKGTGAQMLAELMKTKGVAKELKDRPAIKKALEQPKVTKQELEQVAAENPAPQIEEVADAGSKFASYTIPGGENYREVLIRLPETNKKVMPTFEEWHEKTHIKPLSEVMSNPRLMEIAMRQYERDKAAFARNPDTYRSSHFDEPNILAHARVSDRVGPNGEKILHVEEVQSDWHQEGRKKGYGPKTEKTVEAYYETKDGQRIPIGFGKTKEEADASIDIGWKNLVDIKYETFEKKIGEGVPDAPFKQNWHELVMKRLLDDAARNGYDKVVITPGAEQAKRYDLSKQIGRVVYNPETEMLNAFDLSNRSVIQRGNVKPDQIEEYIGKEPAKRLLDQQNTKIDSRGGKDVPYQEISGLDLQVGGEGMRGFYDQILPSYLNEYGKKYGVRVGTYSMPDPNAHHIPTLADIQRGGMEMFGRADLTPEETLQVEKAFKAQRNAETAIPLHSFDITPQMREEITTKGMPLYQVAPPVAIGAGAAMQEEEPAEYAGGGAVKKALKAVLPKGQQAVLPAAESVANLEKFLAGSAVKDRLYHATSRGGFSTFDRNKTTEWRQPSMDTVGSWFSNNPSEAGGAGMYASGESASIYPVHLSIKNPKVYSTFNDFLKDMHSAAGREMPKSAPGLGSTEELRQKLKAEGYDGIAFEQTANESLMQDIQSMQDAVKRARMEELSSKRAEREPYTMKRERLEQTLDSMRKELGEFGSSTEFDQQRVFVPFEPTQIKSAIGNRGTYDITDPDINMAGGGLLKKAAKGLLPKGQQAVLPAAESAANLERFLADSAVKDRLYHGTNKNVKEFDPNKIGQKDAGWYGKGFYLTSNPKNASNYAEFWGGPEEMQGNNPNVMPIYVSLKNPYYWPKEKGMLADQAEIKSLTRSLKAAGHDGIIVDSNGRDEIIAFGPQQIKSAIGNRGTYDINEADINKAKGGQVSKDTMWMAVQNKQLRKKHGN